MAIDSARKRFAALNLRSGRGAYVPPQSSSVVKRYMLLCLYPFVVDEPSNVYYRIRTLVAKVLPVDRQRLIQSVNRSHSIGPIQRKLNILAVDRSATVKEYGGL